MQVNHIQRLVKLMNLGLFCLCAVVPVGGLTGASAGESLQEVTAKEILRARLSVEERSRRAAEYERLGDEYLKSRQYAAAAEQFTLALGLDPESVRAKAGQAEALRYLEANAATNGQAAGRVLDLSRVREEYNQVEVGQYLSQAKQALDKASQPSAGLNPEQRMRKLSEQLQDLDTAEIFVERAGLRLEGMPINDSTAEQKIVVVTQKADIQRKRAEYMALLEQLRLEKARTDVANEKRVINEVEDRRRNNMLAQANRFLDKLELDLASEVVAEMLRINPADADAKALQEKIRDKRLASREAIIMDLQKENRDNMLRKLEHDAIADVSFSDPMRYPSNWQIMNKRKNVARSQEIVTQQKQATLRRLEEAYSFDFVDAALVEVVLENIRQRTGLNINTAKIDDTKANTTINLTPRNMRLENIFKHILRQVNTTGDGANNAENLTYVVTDAGIINFVTIGDVDKGKAVETKVFDIKDIVSAVQDARKMPTSFDDEDEDDDDKEADEAGEDEMDVAKIICQAYPEFTEGADGNLDYQQGPKKLSVRGNPEQIAKVEELLNRLRAVQNIQVSVSARYLKLRDDFWEQFKSEFYDFDNYNNSYNNADHAQNVAPMSIVQNQARSGINNNGYTYNTYLTSQGDNQNFAPGKYWNEITGSMFNGTFSGLTNVFGHGRMAGVDNQGMSFAIQQRGWLGDIQSQWFIQMIRKSERADELFSPHIVVFNNRYGWIRFQMRVPFIETYEGGGGDYGLVPVIANVEDGCSLQVEPRVSPDKKYVTVRFEPRIEGLLDFQHMQFGSVENAALYTIDLPHRTIFTAKTYATVPDGGAVIIGGLSTNVHGRGRQGIPVLQDLPLVGNAFSNRYYQKSKECYTCLVNAKIILLEEEEARQTGTN